MKYSLKTLVYTVVFSLFICNIITAQDATIQVNQDPQIAELLELKKEVNKSGKSLNLLSIQIYSGNRSGADVAKTKFLNKYAGFPVDKTYETPYYKIRVGRFKSQLEADRALLRIKREFSNAFILNPKNDR